jgi:ketosteroid isomerase-like protein
MSTSATTEAGSLTVRVVACLEAGDYGTLAESYRPDVLLDANMPGWRFQLQGPRAINAYFHEAQASFPGRRLVSCRVTPTADGVVVETEVHFDHHGEERLWRDAHILHTDGERITEHVMYCTGVWDGATIRRHATEAPMVRP